MDIVADAILGLVVWIVWTVMGALPFQWPIKVLIAILIIILLMLVGHEGPMLGNFHMGWR